MEYKERLKVMGIGITELSNGLYQVKQQGEPARVFYTQEQAEKFAKKFSSGTNIQTVTYKQLDVRLQNLRWKNLL